MRTYIIFNVMYTHKYKNIQAFFFPFYVSAIFSVYGQYFGFYFFLIN